MARAHLQRGMNKYCRKTTEVTYFAMERQKVILHLQRGMNKYCRKTTEVTYFDMERQKVILHGKGISGSKHVKHQINILVMYTDRMENCGLLDSIR